MIVLVTAYPRRALELIRYQQIISRAITKFKGTAWLSYDQQFRRRSAYDLILGWDKVDLELWTLTFSGLAKPHCHICSSPYHILDDCPSADSNRKPVCFDFNCPPVVAAATATTHTCAAAAIPVAMLPQPANSSHSLAPVPSKNSSSSERSKK